MRRLFAILLLPFSLVPVALAVPRISRELDSFRTRYTDRDPFAAPQLRPVGYVRPAPVHPNRVPVLVYHGISADPARETVTRQAFAQQMEALDRAGYQPISAATYVRFARGEPVRLPQRPVLITFDDGRLDSYRGADAVLEQHGFRATMFVITGAAGPHSPVYLGPGELQKMEQSGRWDFGVHAGHGHHMIRAVQGGRRPFYAARMPGETLAAYTRRVGNDLRAGSVRLKEIVPQAQTALFAVPYSDYAQTPGAEAAVRHAFVAQVKRRFAVTFIQRDPAPWARRGQTGLVVRQEVRRDTTPTSLLRALRRGDRQTTKKEA